MARIGTNFKMIKSKALDKLKINGNKIRGPLLDFATDQIIKAAEEVKHQFNPLTANVGIDNNTLVGQIGIGLGGKPLYDKMENAWTELIPEGDMLKGTFSKGENFGKIKYTIDLSLRPGSFYNNYYTTYIATSKNFPKDEVIPWMSIYIDGLDPFGGYAYVESGQRGFKKRSSRTGLGHMIPWPGAQFSCGGVGRDVTFKLFMNAIKERFNKPGVKGQLTKTIKNAMRG